MSCQIKPMDHFHCFEFLIFLMASLHYTTNRILYILFILVILAIVSFKKDNQLEFLQLPSDEDTVQVCISFLTFHLCTIVFCFTILCFSVSNLFISFFRTSGLAWCTMCVTITSGMVGNVIMMMIVMTRTFHGLIAEMKITKVSRHYF